MLGRMKPRRVKSLKVLLCNVKQIVYHPKPIDIVLLEGSILPEWWLEEAAVRGLDVMGHGLM